MENLCLLITFFHCFVETRKILPITGRGAEMPHAPEA